MVALAAFEADIFAAVAEGSPRPCVPREHVRELVQMGILFVAALAAFEADLFAAVAEGSPRPCVQRENMRELC